MSKVSPDDVYIMDNGEYINLLVSSGISNDYAQQVISFFLSHFIFIGLWL